jgi:hypothetical protein
MVFVVTATCYGRLFNVSEIETDNDYAAKDRHDPD